MICFPWLPDNYSWGDNVKYVDCFIEENSKGDLELMCWAWPADDKWEVVITGEGVTGNEAESILVDTEQDAANLIAARVCLGMLLTRC
jgi:hypothetical protein